MAARDATFEFSWWGVASAAAWVPSGFCTITAVTQIGISLTICVSCASSAVLNFLVFWLVLGEKMKEHDIGGHTVYLAPVYLGLVCVGMIGLVYGPRCVKSSVSGAKVHAQRTDTLGDPLVLPEAAVANGGGGLSYVRLVSGVMVAFASGVFAAVQYAVVNVGKRMEKAQRHCADDASSPPPYPAAPASPLPPPPPPPTSACLSMDEEFNNFGSWMISFGFGAALVTTVLLGAFAIASTRKSLGVSFPSPQLRVMAVPGSIAGISWSIANFCGTAAAKIESNASGGDAVAYVAMMCIQLVVSGLWGIFWYREVRGLQAVVWAVAALWTMVFMALLSLEKA